MIAETLVVRGKFIFLRIVSFFKPSELFQVDRLKPLPHAPADASRPVHFRNAASGKTLAQ